MPGAWNHVTRDGVAVLEIGDGPRTLVVPRGLVPSSDLPRGVARALELSSRRRFAHGRRVLVVGRRPDLRPGVSMAELADHLATAVSEFHTGPVDVLGVSTAGSLALQFAADHPRRVGRVVAAAAGMRLGDAGRAAQRACAEDLLAGRPNAAARDMARRAVPGRWRRTLVGAGLAAVFARAADPTGLAALLLAEDGFDLSARLADLTAPLLVLAGEEDAFYPLDVTRPLAAGVPDGRLVVRTGAQHHQVTAGREFVEEVRAFLSRA